MDRIDPKVDEAIQTLNMKDGPTRRRLLKGTGLVSATAAASRGQQPGMARGGSVLPRGHHPED